MLTLLLLKRREKVMREKVSKRGERKKRKREREREREEKHGEWWLQTNCPTAPLQHHFDIFVFRSTTGRFFGFIHSIILIITISNT